MLLVWGRDDRLVPVGYAEQWAAGLPDSRLVIIEDCGHVPQVEKTAETLAAVAPFLAGAFAGREGYLPAP